MVPGDDGIHHCVISDRRRMAAETQERAKDRKQGGERAGEDPRQGVPPVAQLQILLPEPDQSAMELSPALGANMIWFNRDCGKQVRPVEQSPELLDVRQLKR